MRKGLKRVFSALDLLTFLTGLRKIADRKSDLKTFLLETSRLIGKAFGHERVAIFVYEESSSELVYLKGWKKGRLDLPPGYRQPLRLGLLGKAARTRRPVVVNNVNKNKEYLKILDLGINSEAVFPITFRDRLLGVLDLQDTRLNAFSQEEVDLISFLSRFLGSALAERRREEELVTQLEKTRAILEGVRDGYYEVDLEGNFTYLNQALAQAWGRSRQEMLGRNYREFLEPESIDRVFRVFNEVFRTGQARSGLSIQVRDIEGQLHDVEVSVSLLKGEEGRPAGFYGIIHDITERVRIEQELREANARFSSLLEALPDIIYFKDSEGRNLIINRAMEELAGMNREAIIGRKDEEFLPKELAAQCRLSDEKVWQEKKPLRFYERWEEQDGKIRYFETIKAPVFDNDGNIIGIVGISRDITEKKLVEDRLKKSERDFRGLFENSTLGLYRTTPEGQILLANPALIKMLGYESFDELSRRNLEKDGFEPGYSRQEFIDRVEKEGEVRGLEAAWRRKDGSVIYVRESARAVRDETGRTLYYEGTVEDISEKKLAEMALSKQKELFQTVIDSAEDVIFMLDRNYNLILWNQAAEKLFGLRAEEIKEKRFMDIYPAENWAEAKKRFDRVLGGEVVRADVELNIQGRKIILNVTEVPLWNEKGEIYALCGIARDLTGRVELERALETSLREKEVLLREMHHRVKNNMQVICSLLNLRAYQARNPELTSILKDCQTRIRSMALVHEHLYKSSNLARINFAEYLNRLLIHLYNVHRQSQEKIELESELEEIFLEIGQAIPLGLMASEIISNSFKHAFPGGRKGKVKVSLQKLEPPRSLRLEISDNGVGLPDNLKPEESQTFGLQLVALLKEQIEASLEIDRSEGTRFVITWGKNPESDNNQK